jgi:protein-L-isoaspartate(D-aspartate) O-methyltransferase
VAIQRRPRWVGDATSISLGWRSRGTVDLVRRSISRDNGLGEIMIDRSSAVDEMVLRQLQGRGIWDTAVLEAMRAVPRDAFVPPQLIDVAYSDRPLPIGSGQTISQPYIVALMLQAAELGRRSRVLDVGTGSGYAAAVLRRIVSEVISVERRPELADAAGQRLDRLETGDADGPGRIRIIVGDGTLGAKDYAPFDAIIAGAVGPRVPQAWVEQLVPGGRIVMPLANRRGDQELVVLTRREDGSLSRRRLGPVVFVPLIGRAGYAER